jgi:hypothetical protein
LLRCVERVGKGKSKGKQLVLASRERKKVCGAVRAGRCVENALRYGISVYDSSYLSLGSLRGIRFTRRIVKLMNRVGGDVFKHILNYKSS